VVQLKWGLKRQKKPIFYPFLRQKKQKGAKSRIFPDPWHLSRIIGSYFLSVPFTYISHTHNV